MKKYQVIAAAAFLVALIAFGCGSDDDGKVTGPTAAEQYEALNLPLEETLEHLFGHLEFDPVDLDEFDPPTATEQYEALELPLNATADYLAEYLRFDPQSLDDFTPPSTGHPSGGLGWQADVGGDSDSLIYVYQDGWHIVSWSAEFEHGQMTSVDSIRFTDNAGQPQEDPGRETTAAMRFIEHWDETFDDEMFDGTAATYLDLSYSNLQSSSAVVDGAGFVAINLNAIVEEKPYHWDVTCSFDVQEVGISNPDFGGSGCPETGSVEMTVAGSLSGYNDEGNPVWFTVDATITAAFNPDGTADITVAIGGSQFSETVVWCEPL